MESLPKAVEDAVVARGGCHAGDQVVVGGPPVRRGEEALERRLEALTRENDELKLYLATLLRCLVSRGTVDIEEFRDLVRVIDAQDGAADGRLSGPVV